MSKTDEYRCKGNPYAGGREGGAHVLNLAWGKKEVHGRRQDVPSRED